MPTDSSPDLRPVHLLLVEDNPHDAAAFRRAISRNLEDWEYHHCPTSEEAIGLLRDPSKTYDVVVADLMLPGMNGLELCQKILALELDIPLVILTGEGTEETAVKALRLGVDDYIIKDHKQGYLTYLPEKLKKAINDKSAKKSLKESEERYALAVAGTNDGIWERNLSTGETHRSPRLLQILGYEPDDFQSSRAIIVELIHPDDVELQESAMRAHLETRVPYDVEYRIRHKSGEYIWVSAKGQAVWDEDGKPRRMAGSINDITERKRLADELRHSQRMEVVGQLTGGLSHDFNNLLGIIRGNTELLAEKLSKKEFDEFLDPVVRATRRGAELTHRLLAFSRRQTLQPKSIRLDELCESMSDLLQRSLGETIEVEINADDQAWNVHADPGQLENALLNLAINASHAMAEGGKLTIRIENATVTDREWAKRWEGRPGEYVALTVADNGTGMPADVIEHVFEPFFTTKGVGEGSGLGLSMVYGFAQQSDGFATIESEQGKGTTVTVYLPRTEAVGEEAPREARDTEIPKGRGETILVVEDEPDLRRLTVRLLEKLGYTTLQAPDGQVALEILSNSEEIDLLLSDVVLPGGVSGPQIFQQVRARRPDLKCLLMSGYAAMPKAALPEGVELLGKPFEFSELAERLRSAFVL